MKDNLFQRRLGKVTLALCFSFTLLHFSVYANPLQEFNDKASFLTALSSPVTIDFSSLTGGTVLTGNEFSAQGLTITHLDGQQLNIISSPPIDSWAVSNFGSLPNALSSSAAISSQPGGYASHCCGGLFFSDTYSENISFDFSLGASAAGIFLGNNDDPDDNGGVGVKFLDQQGNELLNNFFTGSNPRNIFIGIITVLSLIFFKVFYLSLFQVLA